MKHIIFISLFFSGLVLGQMEHYQHTDFHPPLKIPLVLAANFGELRTNHFHTGLDFKTNRREGYSLYSIADGYVSRVKVSPWGYGHVVYVDHYNGLTSVYAHCSGFVGALDSLVKVEQRKQKNFEFQLYPKANQIKVKKGEVIAISGNTGGSTAPHLHFEIRDTKTENALNPLLFEWDIQDTRKPTIRGMKVYGLTEEGYRIPNTAKSLSVFGGNGDYRISNNKLVLPANYASDGGGIGFAFDAIDQLDAADNICGIYRAYLLIDGDTIFIQDMSEISFSSNRYINCHKDYEEFHQRRKHFHKAFKTIHNPLPIYPKSMNNGIVPISLGEKKNVVYVCEDTEGNTASLMFELEILPGKQRRNARWFESSRTFLFPDSSYMKMGEDYVVLFPPGLVYEPTPLIFDKKEGLTFGDPKIPMQEYYKVMLKIKDQSYAPEKYLLSRTNHVGRKYPELGQVNKGWITAWVRDFGTFEVVMDTISPQVVRKNFSNGSQVRGKTLKWSISDNFSGVADYDVYINGKWHLLSYEPKHGGTFFMDVPAHIQGEHKLLIRAKDFCGNITEEEYVLQF